MHVLEIHFRSCHTSAKVCVRNKASSGAEGGEKKTRSELVEKSKMPNFSDVSWYTNLPCKTQGMIKMGSIMLLNTKLVY